ncbi:MAG: DNA alkylation repair protein [Sphingobacteriaceae bacterium]|nr:DNA alkylation repair protein [Sphingobacteriaceae bacterium]
MSELKNWFNKNYFEELGLAIKSNFPEFKTKDFVKNVCEDLDELELNQRMRKTSVVLQEFVPKDLEKTISIFKKTIPNLKAGYTNLIFPDYISIYGKNHLKASLDALKYFTTFGSSEFAIRVFLKSDFNITFEHMLAWSSDKNFHVRRLSSEGSRPRLPWSFKLEKIIENPELTLPILNNLRADDELYVRRSVANHLNDISKDHPGLAIQVAKKWKGKSELTDHLLKHACRTLLKGGNSEILKLFDTHDVTSLKISKLKLSSAKIKMGKTLEFSFSIENNSSKPVKIRVEYEMVFKRQSGDGKKVFHISERVLNANEKQRFSKSHSFKTISTRKYYPGKHAVALIVNGHHQGYNLFGLTN